jgi:hypothetical protein
MYSAVNISYTSLRVDNWIPIINPSHLPLLVAWNAGLPDNENSLLTCDTKQYRCPGQLWESCVHPWSLQHGTGSYSWCILYSYYPTGPCWPTNSRYKHKPAVWCLNRCRTTHCPSLLAPSHLPDCCFQWTSWDHYPFHRVRPISSPLHMMAGSHTYGGCHSCLMCLCSPFSSHCAVWSATSDRGPQFTSSLWILGAQLHCL